MKIILYSALVILIFFSCNHSEYNEEQSLDEPEILESSDLEVNEEFEQLKIDTNNLPEGIQYKGKIKNLVRWKDKLGENIVITTETGAYLNPDTDPELAGTNIELFAFHYRISNNTVTQTWKVHDFIYNCMVDYEASFIPNTFQITDFDNDGIAEIWLMYKTVCHGDISPCNMKVIMYEGLDKYAMRGQNKVEVSQNEFFGGEYKFDSAFINGPIVFRKFALDLWNKNIMQVW